ncbi:MAG: hypothetical protein IJL92_06345 [Thermoguttaceae bacterium]|nr:hypothetical protein [Thermoguttaceae bacterium]
MTTEFNEAVDKFCRDRLQKVLNELNLPFFLRDDFSTKRFNSARLMEVMRLDNGDIYARGSLTRKMVGAIPSDMSDIIPVTPRTFILTPAGVEIGDREAHGYRNVRTNWTRECLSARFWNMYRPEIKDETKNDEN